MGNNWKFLEASVLWRSACEISYGDYVGIVRTTVAHGDDTNRLVVVQTHVIRTLQV